MKLKGERTDIGNHQVLQLLRSCTIRQIQKGKHPLSGSGQLWELEDECLPKIKLSFLVVETSLGALSFQSTEGLSATESRTFQFTSHRTTFLSSLKIVMPGFLTCYGGSIITSSPRMPKSAVVRNKSQPLMLLAFEIWDPTNPPPNTPTKEI
ncbi:hypothetical protein D5086_005233 [Populus alba]|uniref:Uncharacterized protein n=1 Tax=Populus alba TaxID=43335 RepID=A0ACC4CSN8_POPAL